ncbi:MAG: aspartate ammonia-lyase, partial [Candidatus Chloroheliales bacterium]
GFGEIVLPPVQPGSSIMPGKVNPVMAEMLNQVCYHVIGNDLAVALAAEAGQLELNVMMPMIAFDTLESLTILKNSVRAFTDFCIVGITANVEHCEYLVEHSSGLATALAPYIGYEKAAYLAKKAVRENRTIRELAIEEQILPTAQLEAILDAHAMTSPGIAGKK